MKKLLAGIMVLTMLLCGCGSGTAEQPQTDPTEIQVFVAASLNGAITELADEYNKENDTKITINADSSGTLLTQIEEGYECDIFFSAASKQMNQLEEDGLVLEGTKKDLLNNQLVVIKSKGSETAITGLENIEQAQNIALAGGSVPAGKYTRQALVSLGKLTESDDVSKIETSEVSQALGGVEISEQSNVSKVLMAVAEGSCQVGTVYYSDTYGYEDKVEILEKVDKSLTGDIVYPICQVVNSEADEAQINAAEDFLNFLESDAAKAVYEKYLFEIIE